MMILIWCRLKVLMFYDRRSEWWFIYVEVLDPLEIEDHLRLEIQTTTVWE